MKKAAFLIALLCASSAVMAAQNTIHPAKPEIDPSICQAMVEYQPSPDVDYKPGVDVHGKPVVEADLNPSVIQVPKNLSFPLTIDLAEYAGIPVPRGYQGLATIGDVDIKDGKLFWNGQPMEGNAAAAIRDLCAKKP